MKTFKNKLFALLMLATAIVPHLIFNDVPIVGECLLMAIPAALAREDLFNL